MSDAPHILVVEDGHEYVENLRRFLGDEFSFERAGDGPEALERLRDEPWDAVFLDMRFDRASRLLGDAAPLVERFAGDEARARSFLEDNQGAYVLAALRDAGHDQPVLFSYDFDAEPRRWRNLVGRYAPLAYLTDTAGPAEIREAIRGLLRPA